MSLPLILTCLWLIAANVAAMLPTKRKHWPAAIALMVVGAPLWVWLVVNDGWLFGGLALLAAASVLRWPLRFLLRRVRAGLRRG